MTAYEEELSLLEFSEKAIFDMQDILTTKLEYKERTLKKSIEIEEFLYTNSLRKYGESGGDEEGEEGLWQYPDAMMHYKDSIQNVLSLMVNREDKTTDWMKIYKSETIPLFLSRLQNQEYNVSQKSHKRKAPAASVSVKSSLTIPAPNAAAVVPSGSPTGKNYAKIANKKKTKKEKMLEEEKKRMSFNKDWEIHFDESSSSSVPSIPAPNPSVVTNNSSQPSTGSRPAPTSKPASKPAPILKFSMKREPKQEEYPKITHLMHQDSTSSMDGLGMHNLPDDIADNSLFMTEQGDDNFFANATFEHASDWGVTSSGNNNALDDKNQNENGLSLSFAGSAWSTAMHERKSQVEQTDAKIKQQMLTQDERRRVHDDTYKEISSKMEEDAAARAEAAITEEQRVARAREREKRERESQSQTVFMGDDHEAIPYYTTNELEF